MPKQGLKKPRIDHRNRDLHKSFGTTMPIVFPAEYNVDAGIWNPNQNEPNAITGFDTVPAMPEGCTNFAQTDVAIDEDGIFYSPILMENYTHANALGGIDIYQSLGASKVVLNRGPYYQITAPNPAFMDMFDAIRLALLSTAQEKRPASVGTPFYQEWLPAGTMATPVDFTPQLWHNWDVKGWKVIGDQPYLSCKMWTGDWKYMSRALCNSVFAINGSVAFTQTKMQPGTVQTVDLTIVQTIVSYITNIINSFKKKAS